jgi:hypothetical protein
MFFVRISERGWPDAPTRVPVIAADLPRRHCSRRWGAPVSVLSRQWAEARQQQQRQYNGQPGRAGREAAGHRHVAPLGSDETGQLSCVEGPARYLGQHALGDPLLQVGEPGRGGRRQFAVDAPVAPRAVIPREAHHEQPDRSNRTRPADTFGSRDQRVLGGDRDQTRTLAPVLRNTVLRLGATRMFVATYRPLRSAA